MIYKALRQKHPEITIVGTSGPGETGDDFVKGWSLANQLQVPVVDEHYYVQPDWLIKNQYRYDAYKRNAGKVYLGEYASWGNTLYHALAEALYMTGLERNGDVVSMASYAPLFAKTNYTQWRTDMIFFNDSNYYLTPNYHVQKMFSLHRGDYYVDKIVVSHSTDSAVAASCVYNSNTGQVIIKLVNAGKNPAAFSLQPGKFGKLLPNAELIQLSGASDAVNSYKLPGNIVPAQSFINVSANFDYSVPPFSLTIISIDTKEKAATSAVTKYQPVGKEHTTVNINATLP